MSTLLETALEQVVLPQDEQDVIPSQILASLADEEASKTRFAQKRDVIRRLAHEALDEDDRAKPAADQPLLMQLRTARKFWRLFSSLPDEVQADAKRAWRLFRIIRDTLIFSGVRRIPIQRFFRMIGHNYSGQQGLRY